MKRVKVSLKRVVEFDVTVLLGRDNAAMVEDPPTLPIEVLDDFVVHPDDTLVEVRLTDEEKELAYAKARGLS